MSTVPHSDETNKGQSQLAYDKIPVRNVWFLFVYAYDLARFQGRFEAEIEKSPDFRSLIARLLCHVLEMRLRRNLSFGYRSRHGTLKRVRGRIDILKTHSRDLFRRGEVACRFEELTIDTPRNRLIRAALNSLGEHLDDRVLAHRSKMLSGMLGRAGVGGALPSRSDVASDQIARHEAEDRLLTSLARAVFDLVLPTETKGLRSLLKANREDTEFRKLFERAVGNFFSAELSRDEGWRIYPGKQLYWPVGAASPGINEHLPIMVTDIILENEQDNRRIIIDTKFTNILTRAQFGDGERFAAGHIYQLYSYLRSQENEDDLRSLNSEGMLLYPTISSDVDEAAQLQGHFIRFATIDLAQPTNSIVQRLRQLPLSSRVRLRDRDPAESRPTGIA